VKQTLSEDDGNCIGVDRPRKRERRVMVSRQGVDDKGPEQSEALQMLLSLRERTFDSSDEKLALAMGRTIEEIEAWLDGSEPVDEDALMKARGIAMERGIEIEQ
jgi:hypothetical protein